MLIAIDASRATVSRRTGTEAYSLSIIRALIAQGGDYRFLLYFRDRPPDGLIPPLPNVEMRVLTRRRLWTHTALGPAVRRDHPDVLFVPAHVIPWPGIGPIPAVVTLHDLGYTRFPQTHPLKDRLYLDWSTRHSARLARRVIADSQATAHDLMALNGVPQEKIRVIYPGFDSRLKRIEDRKSVEAALTHLGISQPYILNLGSLHPRKNLIRLVEAFDRVKDTVEGLSLVLAGQPGWGYETLLGRIRELGLSERVILTGYVPETAIPALYSGALVYAFPSLYEGFGFPALEAMACGVPLICSNIASLPELVGGAALLFPPEDVGALTADLTRLLTDPALRHTLTRRGYEQVKSFSWQTAGRDTLDVLVEAGG